MNEDVRDKIKLRQWQEADFIDAVKLNKDAKKGLGVPPELGSWEKDMIGIKELFLDGGGDFIVGHIGNEMVLMGGFKLLSAGSAEVKRMRVSPRLHRLGLGSWLLGILEDKMRENGIKTSFVSTLSVQKAALGLYSACGYKKIGIKSGSGVESDFKVVSFKKEL